MTTSRLAMLCTAGLLVSGASACASKPLPVAVMADPVEMRALVGKWKVTRVAH